MASLMWSPALVLIATNLVSFAELSGGSRWEVARATLTKWVFCRNFGLPAVQAGAEYGGRKKYLLARELHGRLQTRSRGCYRLRIRDC